MIKIDEIKIAIIGLGYVGLPLAVEFSKIYKVVGFDINVDRVNELKSGIDSTLELSQEELLNAGEISFSSKENDIADCNIFIITVPTPISSSNRPNLKPLILASELIGKTLKKGAIVIFESTVYPGATEEDCVPIIEKFSSLKFNLDFFVGYSPERINPGDKNHRVADILKVTSGSTPEAALFIDNLYKSVIKAGTHMAPSIKVAEAAKVIENTQRDVNIALINELSIIFNKLNIDTLDVLEAAGTKWNFLNFRQGLVGGHCIGVDPYYLTHKAQIEGYNPEIILAGRRLNDNMSNYVVSQLIKKMLLNSINLNDANILIMGLTFKENCPDIRNTKVIDIISELKALNINVDIYDPVCSKEEVVEQYNISVIDDLENGKYDGIIIAVAHDVFKDYGIENIKKHGKKNHIIYDLKYVFAKENVDIRL